MRHSTAPTNQRRGGEKAGINNLFRKQRNKIRNKNVRKTIKSTNLEAEPDPQPNPQDHHVETQRDHQHRWEGDVQSPDGQHLTDRINDV